MSKKKSLPVPPAARSGKGLSPAETNRPSDVSADVSESRQRNLDKQGSQGNINVNTTNQGYQQDR